MIPLLSSVAPIARDYEAWFCDIWGVMHNGHSALERAVEACRAFRAEGGIVVLLTNAPRPAHSVAAQLLDFGVPPDCYDAIVSSGDVAQHLIAGQRGKNIHHIGPERDYPVIEQAKIQPVAMDEAEVILLTGLLDDDNEVPEDYRDMFEVPVDQGKMMICANPDLMAERGNRLIYCAGALAKLYQDMGGTVSYAGKPYLPIYELAQETLAGLSTKAIDKKRILCIGDGLHTDMPGAFAAELDALFVASQLHVEGGVLDEDALELLFADLEGRPVAALSKLCWVS